MADYEIVVSLAPAEEERGGLLAGLARGITRLTRPTSVTGELLTRFDRKLGHAPVIVERVTLTLAGTPPGAYRLMIEVNDRSAGTVASAHAFVEIRE